MKIIGIGGKVRSGKDTLADMLIEKGFYGVSFGDIVRDFSRERHADKPDPISIANLTDTSNWLRETRGADVILKEALAQFERAQNTADYIGLVLYSVRAPIEVDWILGHGGQLIWVEASDQVRYDRNAASQRQGETQITFEEFKRQENLQMTPQPGIPVEVQMNMSYVMDHATVTLENSGNDIESFYDSANKLIDSLV